LNICEKNFTCINVSGRIPLLISVIFLPRYLSTLSSIIPLIHLVYALRELAFCYQDCLEQSMDLLFPCKIEIVLFVSSVPYWERKLVDEKSFVGFPTERMQVCWLWHGLEVGEWCKYLLDLWFSFQFLVSC